MFSIFVLPFYSKIFYDFKYLRFETFVLFCLKEFIVRQKKLYSKYSLHIYMYNMLQGYNQYFVHEEMRG